MRGMRSLRLVVLLIAAALALLPGAARADTPAPIAFTIQRDGSPIGTHHVRFRRDGDDLIVDIDIRLEVRLAFVTLFRYVHSARETWRDGRLVAFASRTDDDGQRFEVRARATEDGLLVEGSGGSYLAPPGTMPSSYWNAAMVRQARVLDSQTGRLIEVAATPLDVAVQAASAGARPARVYRLTGDISGELAYGPDGDWVALRFAARGSDIAYIRADSSLARQ